jgi:endonuclease-8
VQSVTARGKHLLMQFSGGLVLRTHMRMNGSWHIYRPGERWHRPRRDMRIVVATADFEAVGFNIPVAEFLREREMSRHSQLRQLGPDLLAEEFDEEEAVARIKAHVATPIGDALLDQRLLAGIGNVYKSEVLFACRVDPFAPAGSLDSETIRSLVRAARKLLRANTSAALPPMTTYGGFRRTTGRDDPGQRLWVYGRGRKPCRRCGAPIALRKQGPHARLTYWCRQCQRKGAGKSVPL